MVEGYSAKRGENLGVHHASVSPGYFDVLKMPLLAGRDFKAEDNPNAPRVMIVNESPRGATSAGRDPVGRQIAGAANHSRSWEWSRTAKYLSLSEAPVMLLHVLRPSALRQWRKRRGLLCPDRPRCTRFPHGTPPLDVDVDPNSGLSGDAAVGLRLLVRAAARTSLFLGVLGVISMLLAGVRSLRRYGLLGEPADRGRSQVSAWRWGPGLKACSGMVMRQGLVAGFMWESPQGSPISPGSDPAARRLSAVTVSVRRTL